MALAVASGVSELMTNGGYVSDGKIETHLKLKLWIIIEAYMAKNKLNPVHPGEVLQEEFLSPLDLSQNRLALSLGVPARRINEIVLGKRGISADTALRLAQYFGNSADFWLGLQMDYDLDMARIDSGGSIEKEVRKRA
jgi:addiction module HigA family antidote